MKYPTEADSQPTEVLYDPPPCSSHTNTNSKFKVFIHGVHNHNLRGYCFRGFDLDSRHCCHQDIRYDPKYILIGNKDITFFSLICIIFVFVNSFLLPLHCESLVANTKKGTEKGKCRNAEMQKCRNAKKQKYKIQSRNRK